MLEDFDRRVKGVSFGEDYDLRVKVVDFREDYDLRVKVVDFREDYDLRVKVVDFREDYDLRVKVVNSQPLTYDFNARICPVCHGQCMERLKDEGDILPPPMGTNWLPLARSFAVYRCKLCGHEVREQIPLKPPWDWP